MSVSRWRKGIFGFLVLVIIGGAPIPARAVLPDEVMAELALESRARGISRQVRCMVCQNQSIDDSDAPLARDLRLLIRERIKAGDTDAQVQAFLLDRYGEFVLLRPLLSWRTALLWGAPGLVLLGGLILIILTLRRSGGPEGAPPLRPDEEQRLHELTKL
jgi:cytochrome c-type biogenesis protein CcmH